MFIYNITIKVNNAIVKEWMTWQTQVHTPEIMSTNLFEEFKMFRLLDTDDTEGPTFVFQYYTSTRKNYDEYINKYAPQLRDKALKRWGDGVISFRSLLQSVQ